MLSCWNPADAERRFKKKKLTKADSCTKWQLYRRDQPNGTFTGEISQMVRLQERYVPHQSRVGSIVLNVVKRVAHQSVVIKDARRATHSWKVTVVYIFTRTATRTSRAMQSRELSQVVPKHSRKLSQVQVVPYMSENKVVPCIYESSQNRVTHVSRTVRIES